MSDTTDGMDDAPFVSNMPSPEQLAALSKHVREVLAQTAEHISSRDSANGETDDDEEATLPPKPSYFSCLTPYPRCAYCGEAETLHDEAGRTSICSGYLFDPGLSYDPSKYSDRYEGDA